MTDPAAKTFAELTVGAESHFGVSITPEFVLSFASLSGDRSPIHTDPRYAAETSFGHPIPHGMIAGILFSQLVGMHLPGKHALYLAQTLRFHRPLPMEGEVDVYGRITHKSDATRTVTLITQARDPLTAAVFVEGEATVRLLQ